MKKEKKKEIINLSKRISDGNLNYIQPACRISDSNN